ncbi:hypothetical protein ABFT80_23730 [Mesorhizobium sp. SB112]|uniref:hypothetical protein n=1 Tax=Mesorhizobium sp. SB112 TaxID=3151853 RepID=UPI00326717E3
MRRSILATGLLSATVLASTIAPSFSEALASNPIQGERSIVRIVADNSDVTGREPLRLAQANATGDREDRRQEERRQFRHGAERAGPQRHDREHDRRPARGERLGDERGPRHAGLDLAERLAATETYVGITAGQLDAWRAYSSALIAFFEHPEQDRGSGGPHREERQPSATTQEQRPQPGDTASRPLLAERLADRTIAQTGKAETLKAAVAALRSALSGEQLDRLTKAERAFAPHDHQRGPAGKDAGHRGRPGDDLPPPSDGE